MTDRSITVPESWNDMLLDAGDVELPCDPSDLFGRDAPLSLEIGFGSGRFLEWLSAERPDRNLLGAEISAASHSRAFPKLRDAGRTNVKLFKGSGELVVREMLPRWSLDRVWVNFPDPWPKERHRERRLLDTDFFRVLAGRLEPDGALRLTTDHEAFCDWAIGEVDPLESYEVRRAESAPFVETRYGQKWRREGRQIRHVVFERTGDAPWVPRKVEVRDTMHHATIAGVMPDRIDGFDGETRRLDDGVVAVRDVYERLADGELLVLVHVEEADLTQQILVEVAPTGSDDERRLTVRVRRFNQPLMTTGTSAAVELVAEWVESLDDDNHIVGRQY